MAYISPTKREEVKRTGDGQIIVLNQDYVGPRYPIDDRRFTGPGGFKVELYTQGSTEINGRPSAKAMRKIDITEAVVSIDWSDSLEQAAVEGTLELYDPVSPITGERRLLDIKKGQRIRISIINDQNNLTELGRFIIWEKTRNSRNDASLSISFRDILVYLQKSEDDWLFQKDPKKKAYKAGWTAKQITEEVCKRYGIPLGKKRIWVTKKVKIKGSKKKKKKRFLITTTDLPECKHRNPLIKISGGSVYELLLKVWTEERRATGTKFVIRAENDKLKIIQKREQPVLHSVQEGENLISSTFTDSLEGMATAVTVVSDPKSNSTSSSTQSTDRTTSTTQTTREDTYPATGGGQWKKEVASFFTVEDEGGLACSGFEKNASLMGFGEAAKSMSSSGPFNAMGTLPCGTVIEVRYNGKTMQLPKVDVGAGGTGIGAIPRVMDLTAAAWDAFGINRDLGKVVVEWRLYDGRSGGASSGILATVKNQSRVDRYGYIHKLVKLDKAITQKDAKIKAQEVLRANLRENVEGSVTCFFMPRLRAGAPIFVRDKAARLVGKFYCSDVKHSLTASGCTTTIGLNWLDMVPSALLTDEDKGIKKATTTTTGGSCGEKALEAGRKYIGTPYSWGGGGSSGPSYGIARSNGPSGANIKGFDCSGFVQYCWAQAGVSVPRHTDALATVGQSVPLGQEQPGDILLYSTSDGAGSRYGHTALWSGPGMILNAGGGGGGGVREYARSDHVLARRVSHLCPASDGGAGGGGGGGGTLPPTAPPGDAVQTFRLMYHPVVMTNSAEAATSGISPYVYVQRVASDRTIEIYNGDRKTIVYTKKSMSAPANGVDILVGRGVATLLGIRDKPMQKFTVTIRYR
jgi:cell wall-associated NlpC family hydrolase